ncbi:MAG: repair protein RecN [Desulfovibrionales bacterium]|nr:repair protein RecN [Desulfovibrionales bacterium]
MLELLRIKSLALIDDLSLEFSPGLNVLTGETGAGKSFIMRAVDFLTGEALDRDMVRTGADKAMVEALFVMEDGEELVLRRELNRETGRSRMFLNDQLSSRDAVRSLRAALIQHTSQHSQQRLLSPAFQAALVDGFLPKQELLEERRVLLASLRETARKKDEIQQRLAGLADRRDFMEHQLREIEKVGPKPGEEESLLRRKEALRERQRASQSVDAALDLILGQEGLTDRTSALCRELARIGEIFPDYEPERDAMEAFRERLLDLEVRLRGQRMDDGPYESLDDIESRLFDLSRLKRSLNRSLESIGQLRDELEEHLSFLDAGALDLKNLDKEERALASRLEGVLEDLYKVRSDTAKDVAARLEKELAGLGFSEHVRIRFEFAAQELHPGVQEHKPRLLWIPNPGQPARPLEEIASGGELSRFLLALSSLGAEEGRPTLIFDEVDAGVGGLTLTAVGERIRALARRQQILLITHWPQLAGLADRHFQVSKEVRNGETFTRCVGLSAEQVRQELSRMAGGGERGEVLAYKILEER